jgi:hypothetical protein
MDFPVTSNLFFFHILRQRLDVRKKDKSDQPDDYNKKTVYMQKQDPGLAKTDNSQNNNPHRNGFEIFRA